MAVIETTAFRLREGVDRDSFVAADAAVQTGFAYSQPGLVRRTTARADDGNWIVVTLWESSAAAEASAVAQAGEPSVAAFDALVDATTLRSKRFSTLD